MSVMANVNLPTGRRIGLPTVDKGGTDELVLFGRYATSPVSPMLQVGSAPMVLKAYGLADGESVQVFNVYAPTGATSAYSYKGYPIILTNEDSTALLPLTGNYNLRFTGAQLGNALVTATALPGKVGEANESALRSQLAKPNVFFGPGVTIPTSQKLQITDKPWVMRAYGLDSSTTIQIYNSTTTSTGEMLEAYSRDGVDTTLSETNTSVVLEISGTYRFVLTGTQAGVLLIGNENPIVFIDPFIPQGPQGDQGPQGPQGLPGGNNYFNAVALTDLNYPAVVAVDNGVAHYADPTNNADMVSLLAVTTQAAAASAQIILASVWAHTEPMWNWVPGRIYLALTGGGLTQNPGDAGAILEVGRALSPTTVEFSIQPAILRN